MITDEQIETLRFLLAATENDRYHYTEADSDAIRAALEDALKYRFVESLSSQRLREDFPPEVAETGLTFDEIVSASMRISQ